MRDVVCSLLLFKETVKIISIGEILWDVFPDAEHLGGAPFNFAAHARRLGHEVLFVSAVGNDERGRRALARFEELGLSRDFVACVDEQPTGVVTVQVDASGQPRFTIHRPAAYDCIRLTASDLERLAAFQPDWVCYGTLHQMDPRARRATRDLIAACPGARRFYDVNLRAESYTPELVRELLAEADVVKLNDSEAGEIGRMLGWAAGTLEQFCRLGVRQFGWKHACVTRGERGCALLVNSAYVEVEGYRVRVADAVGAGDAFAAAFLHGLGEGWSPAEIGDFANRVGALVASKRGAIPPWTIDECRALERPVPPVHAGDESANRRTPEN